MRVAGPPHSGEQFHVNIIRKRPEFVWPGIRCLDRDRGKIVAMRNSHTAVHVVLDLAGIPPALVEIVSLDWVDTGAHEALECRYRPLSAEMEAD